MTMTNSGVLRDARPNQPQEEAYNTPTVLLGGLNHGSKYGEEVLRTGSLPLALHHVIPWNLLRDFWNRMRENNYWNCLAVWGSMVGVTQAEMSRCISQGMRRSRFGNAIGLDAKICWAEWNLVRGPQHRSDDPGEELDDMRSSYGTPSNNNRIKLLINHGNQMKTWLQGMPKEASVRELVNTMKRQLNRKGIMEFDPNIWRTKSDSPDFVPATRDSFATQPLWHIRGSLSS